MKSNKNELDAVRAVIRKMVAENMEFMSGDGGSGNAKAALVALAKGDPKAEVAEVDGRLSGGDFGGSDFVHSSGEVYVEWRYEGATYNMALNVQGEFYLNKGSDGRWGASVDDSQAPEPDEAEDVEIHIEDDEFILGDQEGEEYRFAASDFGKDVIKGLELFLLKRYSPLDEEIS